MGIRVHSLAKVVFASSLQVVWNNKQPKRDSNLKEGDGFICKDD